jgi:hypothetical protein
LAIIAAVIFGIPGALLVVGAAMVSLRGDPAPDAPRPVGAAPAQPGKTDSVGTRSFSLFDLDKGECFNAAPMPSDGSELRLSSVDIVPCTEAHSYQVITALAYKNVPWDEGGEGQSAKTCSYAFATDVRKDIQRDRRYQLGRLHEDLDEPSGQKKTAHVICVVGTGERTSGSALV